MAHLGEQPAQCITVDPEIKFIRISKICKFYRDFKKNPQKVQITNLEAYDKGTSSWATQEVIAEVRRQKDESHGKVPQGRPRRRVPVSKKPSNSLNQLENPSKITEPTGQLVHSERSLRQTNQWGTSILTCCSECKEDFFTDNSPDMIIASSGLVKQDTYVTKTWSCAKCQNDSVDLLPVEDIPCRLREVFARIVVNGDSYARENQKIESVMRKKLDLGNEKDGESWD